MNKPPEIPKVIPGRPIPRRSLTRLASTVAANARTWVGGGLSGGRLAGIPFFRGGDRPRVFARLSGTASPYSGVQVADEANGLWSTMPDGLTFTTELYALNGETGLSGKVVELERIGESWIFAYPRKGTSPAGPVVDACFSFTPYCPDDPDGNPEPPTGITLTLVFTPTGAGPVVTVTGSTTSLCIAHSGAGTVAYSFVGSPYLSVSGTVSVGTSASGHDFGLDKDYYPIDVSGCNIGRDGTEITITASGAVSGSCTGVPYGTPIQGVRCRIPVTSPILDEIEISASGARYQMVSSDPGYCGGSITMGAADGYSCCNPPGTAGTCIPLADNRILSTPLGDFAYTNVGGSSQSTFSAIIVVPGAPLATFPVRDCSLTVDVPVKFVFTVPCVGGGVTITYTGCPPGGPGLCNADTKGQEYGEDDDGFEGYASTAAGAACVTLSTNGCPPGVISTGGTLSFPNRYWAGTFTISEA